MTRSHLCGQHVGIETREHLAHPDRRHPKTLKALGEALLDALTYRRERYPGNGRRARRNSLTRRPAARQEVAENRSAMQQHRNLHCKLVRAVAVPCARGAGNGHQLRPQTPALLLGHAQEILRVGSGALRFGLGSNRAFERDAGGVEVLPQGALGIRPRHVAYGSPVRVECTIRPDSPVSQST